MAVTLTSVTISNYVGLSSDQKPASARAGSTFLETNTGLMFVWDGTAWISAPQQEAPMTNDPTDPGSTPGLLDEPNAYAEATREAARHAVAAKLLDLTDAIATFREDLGEFGLPASVAQLADPGSEAARWLRTLTI